MENKIFDFNWDGVGVVELYSNNYRARIIPNLGGNIVKLSFYNEDILNTPKNLATYRNAQNNFGIPHLFPPNRIKKGKFNFNGKEHQFPVKSSGNSLHGFLQFKEWKIEEKVEKQDFVSLTLSYISNEEEDYYTYFPYKFKCTRTYKLDVNGLTEDYKVENFGDKPMPLSIGYHTAFPLKKDRSEKIKVSIGSGIELAEDKIPTGRNLSLRKVKRMKLKFEDPNYDNLDNLYTVGEFQGEDIKHGAIIAGAHSRGDIIYDVDSKYKYWILCNYLKRGDIICIEPQTSSIDAHNRADGNLITLEAGKEWTSKNKLYIKYKKGR